MARKLHEITLILQSNFSIVPRKRPRCILSEAEGPRKKAGTGRDYSE